MHSVNNPIEEAERLYIEQSRLSERLLEEGPPLVIWDVGLGAATNAMMAIRAYEKVLPKRALKIISFENDLDSLKLALKHPFKFPYLKHSAPHHLLKNGFWESAGLRWELVEGDFLEKMKEISSPDFIFYDPFSYKTNSELWSGECFSKIFAKLSEATELYTYSSSTSVRAALLQAGFFVARGLGVGPKEETTIAANRSDLLKNILGAEWLERWKKSASRLPSHETIMQTHPQFQNL
jgi:queuine tRNA-ribosyltransferase